MILKIEVVKGKSPGYTKLSAYDGALLDAGIGNYNLIELSSVIPEGSSVVAPLFKKSCPKSEYGNILYLVIAKKCQEEIGKCAVAGLGWVQMDNGAGLFVEHTGESEEDVQKQINLSLADLVLRRFKENEEEQYGDVEFLTNSIICQGNPVCSIVAAIFCSKGW